MLSNTVEAGFKFFNLKNLKGRPVIKTQADYDEMIAMWADDLQDTPDQVFITACKMLSSELVFYPSFAEVRKKCDELMTGQKEVSGEVWAKYSKRMIAVHALYANEIDRIALFNSIECETTKEACKLFDWQAIGQGKANQDSYNMREFEKVYNSVKERIGFRKSAERALIGTGKTLENLNAPERIKALLPGLTKGVG